jgi:hypothetical protein
MAQPVWVLSVDLQARTATFQSGLASAARSARSSFQEIRDSSHEMGTTVVASHSNIRASIGLLDNTIRGAHGAAMADLLRMFAQTSAGMAALPFLPVIGLIALLVGTVVGAVRAYQEWNEEQAKLKTTMAGFDASVNETFNTMAEKILQAGIRADELANNHLGALHKQLQLINLQSMNELIQQLDHLARAADTVFDSLKAHWYEFGSGGEGAKKSLDDFKARYDELVSKGDTGGASKLLADKLDRERGILAMQQTALARPSGEITDDSWAKELAAREAIAKLSAMQAGHTQKEMEAERVMVSTLEAMQQHEGAIAQYKQMQSANAGEETSNEGAARAAEAARAAAASRAKIAEDQLRGDKAQADARLEIAQASAEQRLQSDLSFAERQRDAELAGNAAQIAALDKSGKDYANQLAAHRQQALEIEAKYQADVAGLRAKAAVEIARRDLTNLEQSIREQIDATDQGSAARLAAIDAAMKAEQAKGLQNTQFYRELAQQRVQMERKAAEEAGKQAEAAGEEQARHQRALAEVSLNAQKDQYANQNLTHPPSEQAKIAQAIDLANREYQIQQQALQQQMNGLDEHDKRFLAKVQELNNKEIELKRQHMQQLAQIDKQAAAEQQAATQQTLARVADSYATNAFQIAVGRENLTKTLNNFADQAATHMISALIQEMVMHKSAQMAAAAHAASEAYSAMSGVPLIGPALGAVAAGAVFAGAMAFEEGGIVPGVGRGDTVPAMLTPGEGVVPKGVMEGLSDMARNGGFNQQGAVHVHVRPTYHLQALDGDGIHKVLQKHTSTLTRHFNQTVRRMNK